MGPNTWLQHDREIRQRWRALEAKQGSAARLEPCFITADLYFAICTRGPMFDPVRGVGLGPTGNLSSRIRLGDLSGFSLHETCVRLPSGELSGLVLPME